MITTKLNIAKDQIEKQTGTPVGAFIFDRLLPEGEITEVMYDETGSTDDVLVLIGKEIVRGRWMKFEQQGE